VDAEQRWIFQDADDLEPGRFLAGVALDGHAQALHHVHRRSILVFGGRDDPQ
jgi:hypothetical protein